MDLTRLAGAWNCGAGGGIGVLIGMVAVLVVVVVVGALEAIVVMTLVCFTRGGFFVNWIPKVGGRKSWFGTVIARASRNLKSIRGNVKNV